MKIKTKTKVIFRWWPAKNDPPTIDLMEVIAIFPEEPTGYGGYMCQSYQHLGQHGGCDPYLIIQYSRPATEKEYTPLKKELEDRGYELKVVKRHSYRHMLIRRQTIARRNHERICSKTKYH